MNKGQVFSIDMLFGVIILIFGIGLLIGAAEINFYNYRQAEEQKEISNKAIIGAQVIANSKDWDCNFSNTHLAYTININKFRLNTSETIKQKANLWDYNMRVSLGEEVLFGDIDSTKNLYAVDLNVLVCGDMTDFNMLKECIINGETCYTLNSSIGKQNLKIEVAK